MTVPPLKLPLISFILTLRGTPEITPRTLLPISVHVILPPASVFIFRNFCFYFSSLHLIIILPLLRQDTAFTIPISFSIAFDNLTG